MKTKKQFKLFTIFEYEKEQDYLRKMHQSGWKLTLINGLGIYYFEKCTPQDVIYQLDYNQDGIHHKEEYLKMFNDCGWEYIQDYFGYSYFRKVASKDGNVEEIFCDEDSKFEMMQRVIKGRVVPLFIIFITVLLPQFIHHFFYTHNYWIACFVGTVLALYLTIFAAFFIKYIQYKNHR